MPNFTGALSWPEDFVLMDDFSPAAAAVHEGPVVYLMRLRRDGVALDDLNRPGFGRGSV